MTNKLDTFNQSQLKKDLPDIRPGDNVRVYQKIPALAKAAVGKKEEDKEKTQVFEGLVIARKHGRGISSTITVRKVISGIGVEKTLPLHSPIIEKIDIVKRGEVRRAKLYYLRKAKGKKARLKKKKSGEASSETAPKKRSEEPVKE